jgi:hypothetical protein
MARGGCKSFPQSMLMIIKGLIGLFMIPLFLYLIEFTHLSRKARRVAGKKGESKNEGMSAEVIENTWRKMSALCSEQKLLKNKQLIIFLKVCS